MEVEKKKREAPTEQESPLLKIISLHQMEGFWNSQTLDEAFLNSIGVSQTKIAIITSLLPEGSSKDLILTIAILIWLETNAQAAKDKWLLVSKKTERWIKAQNIPLPTIRDALVSVN
eukprot:TRINITY_DN2071_c0_g1_i4.p1 TRINITY_DN2071_c0_g1~~TRINITY_DN2071_c0_g1_i4.p1  ORF type:complete len:117 (+),score=11.25 TRINITY_DN2071_c0_g1_i4:456-806(+)